MEANPLAFAAALLTLRLAGLLASRWRQGAAATAPGLERGACGLCAGSRCDSQALGIGGRLERWRVPGVLPLRRLSSPRHSSAPGRCSASALAPPGSIALVYTGLAAGIALGVPIEGTIAGTSIPEAQEHLKPLPGASAGDHRQHGGLAGTDRSRLSRGPPESPGRQPSAARWVRRGGRGEARSQGWARRRPPSS